MPIYEYVCRTCGHRMEVLHGIHAPGPGACEACGGPVRKALSPPAIVFKGSGWAKKDARASSSPRKDAPAKESTPARDGEGAGASAGSSTSTGGGTSTGSGTSTGGGTSAGGSSG